VRSWGEPFKIIYDLQPLIAGAVGVRGKGRFHVPGQSLTRTMYREQIKEVLLERILDGAYEPGERIVETRVAREFGVSQGPVREALRELESLRLVVSEPFVGVRVRAVTLQELGEIYPVRSGLEEVAARTAALRLGGDVRAIEAELEAMRRVAATGDVHEFMLHDVQFHRLIVEGSGNRTLTELWTSLHVEARTMITYTRYGDLHAIAESHVPILEALRACDPEGASATLRHHFEYYARWVTVDAEVAGR
jgi:DNA-binding GntR family transcriptional regulator